MSYTGGHQFRWDDSFMDFSVDFDPFSIPDRGGYNIRPERSGFHHNYGCEPDRRFGASFYSGSANGPPRNIYIGASDRNYRFVTKGRYKGFAGGASSKGFGAERGYRGVPFYDCGFQNYTGKRYDGSSHVGFSKITAKRIYDTCDQRFSTGARNNSFGNARARRYKPEDHEYRMTDSHSNGMDARADADCANSSPEKQSTIFLQKWDNCYRVMLLYVYEHYKSELLPTSSDADVQIVWGKIAKKMQNRFLVICDSKQCFKCIHEMMNLYKNLKETGNLSQNLDTFTLYSIMQKVFETEIVNKTEMLEKTPNPTSSSVPLLTDLSPEQKNIIFLQKWNSNFRVMLLYVYEQHKSELLYAPSDADIKIVWEKIAKKMQNKFLIMCNYVECSDHIYYMMKLYKKLKYKHKLNRTSIKLYAAMQKVFEIENLNDSKKFKKPLPVNLSCGRQSGHLLRKRRQLYRPNLLSVCAKYKSKLSSTNLENIPWTKVAKEMQDVYFMKCDPAQCFYNVFEIMILHENFKQHGIRNKNFSKLDLVIEKILEAKNMDDSESLGKTVEQVSVASHINSNIKIKSEYSSLSGTVSSVQHNSSHGLQNITSPNIKIESDHSRMSETVPIQTSSSYKQQNISPDIKIKPEYSQLSQTNPTQTCSSDSQQNAILFKKWDRSHLCVLLHVYGKYKSELSSINGETIVWEKIAKEIQYVFSIKCNYLQCFHYLQEIRCLYENLKKSSTIGKMMTTLYAAMQNVFDTNNLNGVVKLEKVTNPLSVVNQPSSDIIIKAEDAPQAGTVSGKKKKFVELDCLF